MQRTADSRRLTARHKRTKKAQAVSCHLQRAGVGKVGAQLSGDSAVRVQACFVCEACRVFRSDFSDVIEINLAQECALRLTSLSGALLRCCAR